MHNQKIYLFLSTHLHKSMQVFIQIKMVCPQILATGINHLSFCFLDWWKIYCLDGAHFVNWFFFARKTRIYLRLWNLGINTTSKIFLEKGMIEKSWKIQFFFVKTIFLIFKDVPGLQKYFFCFVDEISDSEGITPLSFCFHIKPILFLISRRWWTPLVTKVIQNLCCVFTIRDAWNYWFK